MTKKLCFLMLLLGLSAVSWADSIIVNGDLDMSDVPAGWVFSNDQDSQSKGEWTSKYYRSEDKSLLLSKTAGATSQPGWTFGHSIKGWQWNSTTGWDSGKEIEVGGYVKTQDLVGGGELVYSLYGGGAKLFGQDIVLDIAAGTSDWSKLVNSQSIVLPAICDSVVITFRMKSGGSGTMMLDDIICHEVADNWIGGDIYNCNLNMPEGWFYWVDKMMGGDISYGRTTVSEDAAHSGKYSLKVMDLDGKETEVVAISDRNLLPANGGGKTYRFGVWVKLDGTPVDPDDSQRIGFTLTWHREGTDWSEIRGEDFRIVPQTSAQMDWRYFEFEGESPAEANRVSVRARLWHNVTGKAYFDDFTCEVISGVTGVDDTEHRPVKVTTLSQNYPNPFNPSTLISYNLARPGQVSLKIYNMLGQEINQLVSAYQSSGRYTLMWDGTNRHGRPVGTGMYFYVLKTDDTVSTRKMLLLK